MLRTLVIVPVLALGATAVTPPVLPTHIIQTFRAPLSVWGSGHRGTDYAATPGQPVLAPADGMVAFVGRVGGKDVMTLLAADGTYSLEPVRSSLPIGTVVSAGDPVGHVGLGGHCSGICVHLGLRVAGVYVPFRQHAHLLP